MPVNKNNLYSFDDCSILHSFAIQIPDAFLPFFEKKTLKAKNHDKLNSLLESLKAANILPNRFVPCKRLEDNLIKAGNELIEDTGINIGFLPKIFKIEVMDSLKEFMESLTLWNEIQKKESFSEIKQFFQTNKRQLKKAQSGRYSNIPEDDDCSILAGLNEFEWSGVKFLITEDEHFWGYGDLISRDYNITAVKEWECHKLC